VAVGEHTNSCPTLLSPRPLCPSPSPRTLFFLLHSPFGSARSCRFMFPSAPLFGCKPRRDSIDSKEGKESTAQNRKVFIFQGNPAHCPISLSPSTSRLGSKTAPLTLESGPPCILGKGAAWVRYRNGKRQRFVVRNGSAGEIGNGKMQTGLSNGQKRGKSGKAPSCGGETGTAEHEDPRRVGEHTNSCPTSFPPRPLRPPPSPRALFSTFFGAPSGSCRSVSPLRLLFWCE